MMSKQLFTVLVFPCAVIVCLFLAQRASADEWNQETILTFSAPVRLPGVTLPAGTYDFKMMNDDSYRNFVLIYGGDRTHLLHIVRSITDYRLEPTDRTVITFAETSDGIPNAIKEWFYPGETVGHEFVYPKSAGVAY